MTLENAVEGGCLCGSVRFAVSKPLALAAYCLCSDCRKTTGSAFNISVPVTRENFRLLSGSPKGFTKASDQGVKLTRLFCPDCGSPVYTFLDRYPDRIYVKGERLMTQTA
ncbi:GFA family protein [Paeniroseomonas aquatica]|uniref:GFA family protein n=1 Tax=Paeniroseomonas aquatica TaxID=373043 RepID=UPI00360B2618